MNEVEVGHVCNGFNNGGQTRRRREGPWTFADQTRRVVRRDARGVEHLAPTA
jgi:hypothetical protein